MASPSQRFKESCFHIIESVLSSVKPENLLGKKLALKNGLMEINGKIFDLSKFSKTHIIAAGKAAIEMTQWILSHTADKISGGIVISDSVHSFGLPGLQSFKGNHPVPGPDSLNCGRMLTEYINNITARDLVIGLVSGGSSAMILSPPDHIDPEDIVRLNRALLRSGADICEINIVRKHISSIKGGKLAEKILPASIVNLMISDVKGDDPGLIGSGMFSRDQSTFEEALKILHNYSLLDIAGNTIIQYLESPVSQKLKGRTNDWFQEKVFPYVVGNNTDALQAAIKAGKDAGFDSKIVGIDEEGNVKESSKKFARVIKDQLKTPGSAVQERLFVFGGEFTVSVKGNGRGGRIQEFLLYLLYRLRDVSEPFLVAGIGTDGRDGPTDAAGAWISNKTFQRAGRNTSRVLSALDNNDSYGFFKELGQLIFTGRTGTNVRDIFFVFLA